MIRVRIAASLLLLTAAGSAPAALIYDTNGTFYIDSIRNDNVEIYNGADVVIGHGGAVIGSGAPSPVSSTIFMNWSEAHSTLSLVSNGRVEGSIAVFPQISATSRATVRLSDHATVVGSIWSDTALELPLSKETAHQRLFLEDHATVDGSLEFAGYVQISDHALVTGDVSAPGSGNVNFNMDGGTIAGTLRVGSLNDHIVNLSGGAILGGVNLPAGYTQLQMTGGYVDNGFNTLGELRGEIRDGRIDGGLRIAHVEPFMRSNLAISGGSIDAALDGWLLSLNDPSLLGETNNNSLLEIWGGHFGYQQAGLGIFVDSFFDLSVHGRDLTYNNGWLSGYLQDGSWFNNALTFGDNWSGTLTLHNVPEPGTLALFVLALSGVGLAKRRRQINS